MRFRIILLLVIIFGYVFFINLCYDGKVTKESFNDNGKKNIVASDYKEDFNEVKEDILGFIIIPKINIKRNLYPLDSSLNNVDKNIEVLKGSSMPDVSGGNFILAAHNGESPIAYFHDLDKLENGDEVTIGYGDIEYRYVISNKYEVQKTGKVEIKRDKNKKTITLITCKGENEQLVVIGYSK